MLAGVIVIYFNFIEPTIPLTTHLKLKRLFYIQIGRSHQFQFEFKPESVALGRSRASYAPYPAALLFLSAVQPRSSFFGLPALRPL